ncbi:MAG: helix-turn-helix domain-containing protein [Chloroflexota bacterium]|nr:helix-turn-helix domain-containing protein [Chloroflexota bacterium]
MAGSNRRLDRALRLSRELTVEAAREILLSRDQAGLSQDAAASAVGMSGSQYGRIERAELRHVTVEQLARAASAVGLRPSLRLYPDGDAVRDAGHVRLLERLRNRLPGRLQWRTEVPLRGQGDLRSSDAQIWYGRGRDAVEAETRIRDAQATWRRIAMKLRDDPTIDHVVLLLADTPANRRAMAHVRELLRSELPLDTRSVLGALEAGRSPGANGVAFL